MARSISTPPGRDASPSQVTSPQFVRFPQQFAGTHLYSWVERGTVRVKCLAHEHNNVPFPCMVKKTKTWWQFHLQHCWMKLGNHALLLLLWSQCQWKHVCFILFFNAGAFGQEQLRRFTHIPTGELGSVDCPFRSCDFKCTSVEEMLQHQSTAKHPGWSKKCPPGERSWHCEGCGKNYATWNVLTKHLDTHKKPFQRPECQYSAASVGRLRKHMLVIHIIVLDRQWHWVRRRGGIL